MIEHLWHWAVHPAAAAAAIGATLLMQSTLLIAAGLFAAALARRRSAAVRSAILRATLVAVIASPLASWILARAGANQFHIALPALSGYALLTVMAVAIAGLLLVRLALAISMVRGVRLSARSASVHWIDDAGRCARIFGMTTPPVLQSDRFTTPCLVGFQRPVILLPTAAKTVRHDVLIHELAHLRRRDCLWHLFCHIARALLWFQPLMWLLTRRIEQSADEVCDDFVVAYGGDRAEYARALVDIAERHQMPWVGSASAVGMAGFKSNVSRRVVRIMDNTRTVSIDSRRMTLLMVLALSAGATLLTALLGTSISPALADNAPTPGPRLAVPDASAQAKKEKLIRDVFGNFAAAPLAERPALAAKLIEQGMATADDPAARYVMLKDGGDLAASAGDASTAMRAASLLASLYAVDPGELKLSLFRRASNAATTPAVATAVASEGLNCANEALAAGNYDLASRFMFSTEQAAHTSKDITLILSVQSRAADIKWLQQESVRARTAEEKLNKSPTDPDANHTLGRYFCLVRGDWARGLIGLSKGSNPAYHAAAVADLANPTTTDKQVAAGDLWWDLAEKETAGAAQRALRRRAGYWYSQAAANPQLAGLSRALVEKKLSQIPPPGPGEAVAEVPPAVPAPAVPPPVVQPPAVTPPVVQPPAVAAAPSNYSVLLFRGHSEETPVFNEIARGRKVNTISAKDAINVLADPNCFANVTIVAFGGNQLHNIPAAAFSNDVLLRLRQFVENGGDLITLGNGEPVERMQFLNTLFGLRVIDGAHKGAVILAPDLLAAMHAAGLDASRLGDVVCVTGFEPPPAAQILMRASHASNDIPVAGILPFGKGRVIFLGNGFGKADVVFDDVFLRYVYANAALQPAVASSLDLTTVQPTAAQVGFATLGVNAAPSFVDHLPKLNGAPATRYFFAHAPSKITFAAGSFAGKTFVAKGVVTHPGTHGVIFIVQADGKEIFRSKLAKHDEVIDIEARLPADARVLELIADPDGVSTSAWAFWTYPAIKEGASAQTPVSAPADAGNILNTMALRGHGRRLADGSIEMPDGQLDSAGKYAVPFHADFVAKTNSTNLRISFGRGQLIFNWAGHPETKPLRFTDPAKGPDRVLEFNDKGSIPPNEFVRITWIVDEHSTSVFVNGEQRALVTGEYKGLFDRLSIYPREGSVVTVKSVSVSEGTAAPTPAPGTVDTPPAGGNIFADGPAPAANGATELLHQLNLQTDVVAGTWTRGDDGITSAGGKNANRIRLPYNPPPEYDLRVIFTLHAERGAIGVLLAHNDASGMWFINYPNDCRFRGTGDPAHMMPEKIVFLEPRLTIGAKHEAIIKVRNNSIATFIDGKAMSQITEDYSQCRLEKFWPIGDHAIGLTGGDPGVTYHSVEVHEVSAKAAPSQPASATPRNPAAPAPAYTPPAGGNIFTDGPAPAASNVAQAFARERSILPLQNQIAATVAKLKEINGGTDIQAKLYPQTDGTLHVDITNQDALVSIEPLYGLRVSKLNLDTCKNLKSLNGVQGMPLTELNLTNCFALEGDLSVLKGMRLTKLGLRDCKRLKSLSGIQGMPLTELNMDNCFELEGDLSALKGMQLTKIHLGNCKKLEGLNGLQGMPLTELELSNCFALEGDLSALKGMRLTHLSLFGCQRLENLNGIQGMPLTGELNIAHGHVLEGDLTALTGMQLTRLDLYECFKLKSLNGIQGMPLTELNLTDCHALEGDLSALKGMPLTKLNLYECQNIKSLDGLEGAPLKELTLTRRLGQAYVKTLLQTFPTLKYVQMGDQKLDEEISAELKARKGLAPAPALPGAGAVEPPGAARKNIILFVGDRKEEAIFRAVPGANLRVVEPRDTANVLANAEAIGGANIIVWGRNELIGVHEEVLTNAVWESMRRFMEAGGDLVIFEQGPGGPEAARHLKTNWAYIEKNFAVTYQGGPINRALVVDPALAAKCTAAGLGADFMDKVSFCDGYHLPPESTVLVRAGGKHEWPVMAGVPVGKGRLILVGTNLNPTDEPLSKILFDYIYGGSGAHSAVPAPGAQPATPGLGGAIFGDTETKK